MFCVEEEKEKKEEDVLFLLSLFAEIWLKSCLLIRLESCSESTNALHCALLKKWSLLMSS